MKDFVLCEVVLVTTGFIHHLNEEFEMNVTCAQGVFSTFRLG